VSFTADLRHQRAETLLEMDARFRAACADLAEGRTLGHKFGLTLQEVSHFPPTPFDAAMVDTVRDQAARRGYRHMDIVTGAGHDAVYVATVNPTAMIFVPCKDGISHNEIEDAKPGHLEAGANVLLGAMLTQAGLLN